VQGAADHCRKIKTGDVIVKVFDKDVCDFLPEDLSKMMKEHAQLLEDAVIVLTLKRNLSRCNTPVAENFSRLLDSPKGYHDLVLVGSDGEIKAHKFVLAGLSFVLTVYYQKAERTFKIWDVVCAVEFSSVAGLFRLLLGSFSQNLGFHQRIQSLPNAQYIECASETSIIVSSVVTRFDLLKS
jgi:hypothetical protein